MPDLRFADAASAVAEHLHASGAARGQWTLEKVAIVDGERYGVAVYDGRVLLAVDCPMDIALAER